MTTAFRTSSFTFGGHRLVYDEYGEGTGSSSTCTGC